MKRDGIDKYKEINRYLDIIGVILVIALVIITFIYWGKAPDIVPTHYNFKGEIDAYGSKNTLFILLPIAVIMYVGVAILAKFPSIYNYPVEINQKNKEKQYSMATTFIRVINVEVLVMFLYVQVGMGYSMNNNDKRLSIAFSPILLFILFGSVGYYIYKAIKCK